MLRYLTSEQLQLFNETGYLILPNFFHASTVCSLKHRMVDILSKFDESTPRTIFTTGVGKLSRLIAYLYVRLNKPQMQMTIS